MLRLVWQADGAPVTIGDVVTIVWEDRDDRRLMAVTGHVTAMDAIGAPAVSGRLEVRRDTAPAPWDGRVIGYRVEVDGVDAQRPGSPARAADGTIWRLTAGGVGRAGVPTLEQAQHLAAFYGARGGAGSGALRYFARTGRVGAGLRRYLLDVRNYWTPAGLTALAAYASSTDA